jgi:hypothetical protein
MAARFLQSSQIMIASSHPPREARCGFPRSKLPVMVE